MNKKRSHFKMICLVSVAVLLGACSSTPEVEKPNVAAVQASVKQQPLKKNATSRPIKQQKLASIETKAVPTKAVRAKALPARVAVPKTVVKRNVRRAVVSRKPVYVAKKQKRYVPPKPIVVAVRSTPKPATSIENPNLRRPSVPRASTASKSNAQYLAKKRQQAQQQQARIQRAQQGQAKAEQAQQQQARIQRAQQEQARAEQAQQQQARIQQAQQEQARAKQAQQQQARIQQAQQEQARAEQAQQQQARIQQAQQQQAREQWEKERQRLAYLVKWERGQVAKIQEQQARVQQAQQQARVQQAQQQQAREQWQRDQQARVQMAQQEQVRAEQAQQQQARVQLALQQQARVQWQKNEQARVRQAQIQQAQARQQQARVQQASYKPQVLNRPVQRPTNNYSQSRLTGDFAGNPRAEAFVRMMSSRHGFDASYVAGVLSRADATPWLRKQAYKDANPTKRTKKSTGPSWSNYRRRFITSKHINTGAAFYQRYRNTLERAASQYGVPAEYILGILGVETIYGGNVGADRAIDALSTLGFMNARRGNYFTSELESYFLMTRNARLDPLQPKASWAGALGLPQFMPSNIKKFGVDYDGDGAVNLWTPHDAIGSVANYLRKHGWKPGEIAAIPAVKTGGRGYSNLKNGFKYKHSLATLARNGLRPSYPGVSGMVNMVKLRTNRGNEYWVGGNNFYVITRYNHSSHYAMAVHQLAQEIRKRVKPGSSNSMPRVIEASNVQSNDQNLLMQAASSLL